VIASGHVLRTRPGDAGSSDLLAPSVGVFAPAVTEGELVSSGQVVGTLDVLGVLSELTVAEGVAGRVTKCFGGARSRVPVQYGDALLAISIASSGEHAVAVVAASAGTEGAPSFVAPMSGRFYSQPSPTEPPFVSVGDIVQRGQTIGLLEVMKTFNRLVYQGDTLPEQATVENIVPNEGDDVVRGDVILALRSLSEK
jgi:acetyl-CoA carboxylase biotin carboxyl carrier protein